MEYGRPLYFCPVASIFLLLLSFFYFFPHRISAVGDLMFDNRKKVVKQQCLPHMFSQYGELWPTNGWDLLASLGHPSKFQRVSRLTFVTAATSLTGGQQNCARCLAVSWAGTQYIHFRDLLPLTEFCRCKFTLRPSVAFSYIGSVTARHVSSGVGQTLRRGTRSVITELSQRAPPIFGRTAITLGIGPRSSWKCYDSMKRILLNNRYGM